MLTLVLPHLTAPHRTALRKYLGRKCVHGYISGIEIGEKMKMKKQGGGRVDAVKIAHLTSTNWNHSDSL